MKPFELLKNAQQKKANKVIFEIPLEEGMNLAVMLRSVDLLLIREAIEMEQSKLMAKYSAEGLDKIKPNKIEWDEYIDGRKTKLVEDGKTPEEITEIIKAENDSKPKNEAERLAKKFSYIFAAREVIPTLLRDPMTDNFICETKEERDQMVSMVREDSELMTLIASKYGELVEMGVKIEETVKNS